MHSSTLSSEKAIEEVAIEEMEAAPVWRRLLRLRHLSPVVFHTALFLLLAHLIVAAVMPLLVSDEIYLSLYLGKDARESTKRFLDGKHPFLLYDPILGWRNRPDVKHDKWIIDEQGARTTHRVGASSSRKRYVLFLGDSLINGSMNVSNEETLSAYIEDASTESINFATMLYTLDQIYLDYKERLGRYKVDVVVVGLPGEESTPGLLNQYIPFRVRAESKMPFLKPRFEMRSDALSMLPVPSLKVFEGLLKTPALLKTLEKTDAYYGEFSGYKRFGLMPGSNVIYSLYKKIRAEARLTGETDEGMPILKKLIDRMALQGRERNAAMVFVALPDLKTVAPRLWQRVLPDRYAARVKELKGEGYTLLDVRPALRESGLPPEELFDADGVHYSSAGNRIIAAALKHVLEHLCEEVCLDSESKRPLEMHDRNRGEIGKHSVVKILRPRNRGDGAPSSLKRQMNQRWSAGSPSSH